MINLYQWAIDNGATIRERNAMFNQCAVVWIVKDCDESGRMFWHGMISNDQHKPGGFSDTRDKTRKALLALYAERCPNMRVIAEHGQDYRIFQSGNVALFPEESVQ